MLPLLLIAALALPQGQTRDPKAPPAQTAQPAGKGAIAGTVVSADRGQAVRRARVVLNGGTPKVTRAVQTDDQGAFRFADLPSGQFTLTASKGGYVESIFGQRQPGSGRPGTPIRLLDNQELTRIALPLARGGVITGAVYDEAGEPAFGESLSLLRWVMKSGERVLDHAASATTDDRGIYRFPALLPGDYVVSTMASLTDGDYDIRDATFFKVLKPNGVSLSSGNISGKIAIVMDRTDEGTTGAPPTTGFAAVYYPGTRDVSAAMTVSIAIGEERSGVDFRLQPVPIGRVGGAVTGPDGPVPGVDVQLIDRGQPSSIGVRTARAGKDGRFQFSGVPPGQYLVFAHATAKSAKSFEAPMETAKAMAAELAAAQGNAADQEKKRQLLAQALAASAELWGMADVAGDGRDVDGVTVVLQPGLTLAGHVAVETGTGASPTLNRLMISVEPIGQQIAGERFQPPPALVDANGDFVIRGVFPGRYRLSIAEGAPSGYAIRSAVFGGQDIMDLPLRLTGDDKPAGGLVTLSNRTTEVSGAVQDSTGQPASAVTLIAYSADERFWTPDSRRIQSTRPSTDGKYGFRNLPPGDYRLVAVDDIEPGRWFDPAVLRALTGFTTLTVLEGGKLTQDLRIK